LKTAIAAFLFSLIAFAALMIVVAILRDANQHMSSGKRQLKKRNKYGR